ncbi:MAG: hypothetical protein KatS3mg115_0369 [Candidatus Poribacteria bacterium]|nr:MAG: hypothetical protein KatS3mg115_0369 [Candidatus Poribacteria bacterium]
MRICPSCGAEYVDDRRRTCADCGVPLVYPPEDAQEPQVEYVDWKLLIGVPNLVVGTMILGVLRQADIPARLQENTIPVYGGVPSSPFRDFWGEVYVPERLYDLARQVVEEYLEGLEVSEAAEGDEGE